MDLNRSRVEVQSIVLATAEEKKLIMKWEQHIQIAQDEFLKKFSEEITKGYLEQTANQNVSNVQCRSSKAIKNVKEGLTMKMQTGLVCFPNVRETFTHPLEKKP